MLARQSLGASVCLRCRLNQARLLRLGRAPVAPLAATTAISSSSASTFTSLARQLRASEPFAFPDAFQPEIRRDASEHNPLNPIIRHVSMGSHKPIKSSRGSTTKHIKLDKPIRVNRKGDKMKEISAPLQRKYLGKDSEVLILRDITPIRKREDDNAASSSSATADATGEEDAATKRRREIREALEASIAGKQAVAGQEEANEQINKLRPVSPEGPQYPPFISRKDFKALRKALKDGYAVAQLRRYADVQESLDQLQQLKREERAELGVLWESAWQEGTSSIEQRLPEADRPDVPVAALPKMKVVDRIIRGLWGVGVIEESYAVGEIEIKLEPWHFDLLTLAKRKTASCMWSTALLIFLCRERELHRARQYRKSAKSPD